MKLMEIDPQISMLDLLDKWPEAIPILIRYHMSCVGCQMARFDSLEYAAKVYDISLSDLIQEIHQASQAG